MMVISTPGLSAGYYLGFAWEYGPDTVVDKRRGEEHINSKIIDKSEPRPKIEVTNPYKP